MKSKAVNEFDEKKVEKALNNLDELDEKFEKRAKHVEEALKVDWRHFHYTIREVNKDG